jgi:alpha-L-rhamnosidase
MKKSMFALLVILQFSSSSYAQSSTTRLRVENRSSPVGLDAPAPRLSWELSSDRRNVRQTAYEIHVARSANALTRNDLAWNSGKVQSDHSILVPYVGPALQPGQEYAWQVRVWDETGKVGAWSDVATWRTGMMQASNWKAKWITPGYTEDSVNRPSPYMRKTFKLTKKAVAAIAFITARGMYEAEINGRRIGDAYLTPGWTSYRTRLQYQVYDVTDLLNSGANAIGVTLGSGWYRGIIGFENSINVYGKETALLFQLEITYSDGSKEQVLSDGSWSSSTGPIRYSEIYNGETVDARLRQDGWSTAGFKEVGWVPVAVKDYGYANLVATENEPVRKHERFRPIRIFTSPKGESLVDFGQNLVGWVVLKAKGKSGDAIRIFHAEVLDKDGNFYTDNLRAARATDQFILSGKDEETFEPHFTFHGFRFVKLEGYPGELRAEDISAVTLYSDMEPTGSFSSSSALLNQLQHNIQWGQKGNFLDVPTDCPQRDERLGWTGDAQVFSRTAAFNMNVDPFFTKWLKDVAADQTADGSVPFVVPNVLGAGAAGSTGWADVATIIPWNMYLAYGDRELLATQYPSMKAWVEYMRGKSRNDLWNTGFHFGDWLFYRPFDDNDGSSAVTDKYLIAQCFWAHSTQLLIEAATVLGRTEDVATYTTLLQKVKAAFNREYVTGSGRLVSGTQTAYVLALQFDMLPEAVRADAAARLARNVKDYGNHLTTGFLGTPYLCHVLTRFGYNDVAYTLLMQETYPSWLYPVRMGATTIWERWDGMRPDSTFQTPGMNSFNHYAYGAIGDWMYRVVAGIDTDPAGPGYRMSTIRPHPGGGLTHAEAALRTPYGRLSSAWKLEGSDLVLDIEVPANTTSSLSIPAKDAASITEGGRSLAAAGIGNAAAGDGTVTVNLGSGKYHFTVSSWK